MKSSGKVKSVEKNRVTLSMYKESACSHCNKCSDSNKIANDYTIYTNEDIKVGDIVTFEMDDSQVLKAATIVYIIPVISIFLGYFLGSSVGLSEGKCILLSLIGLVTTFAGIYFYDKLVVKNRMEKSVQIISVEKGENHE